MKGYIILTNCFDIMNIKTLTITVVIATLIARSYAEDEPLKLETLLGYKNVTVTKVEPDGIRIMHDSGTTKVPIEKIPEELKIKLGLRRRK